VRGSPGGYTISGPDGSRIANGSNAEYAVVVGKWLGGGSTSAGQGTIVYTCYGTTSTAEVEYYDPAFIAEILAADAAPAEEGFDNVVDLLDWLNRD
jgi:hypothetical protein